MRKKNSTLKIGDIIIIMLIFPMKRGLQTFFGPKEKKAHSINILINSAAVSQSSLFISTNSQNACEVLNTNILGLFHVSKFAVRIMQKIILEELLI